MCRYIEHNVKTHFACFGCQKAFKYSEWTQDRKCPECAGELIDMGKDFKPPRKTAHSQWKKVKLLIDHNVRFNSCGCYGPGNRPKTYSEAKRQYG